MQDNRQVTENTPRPPGETVPSDSGGGTFFVELLKFALIAAIIVIPIRVYLAQPFIVAGASMEPTFDNGEYLIVDQLSYRFEEPKRGDVIIFRFPKEPSKFLIKRIVGLPNETVEIRQGAVFVRTGDGTFRLSEPYVEDDRKSSGFLTTPLGSDEYFVLGDNRSASSDSRVWGPLPKDLIVGRALIRLLPVSEFGVQPGSDPDSTLTAQ